MRAVLEPLVPVPPGPSRPWTDHRLAAEGMVWKYRTGAPWREIPERFGMPWRDIPERLGKLIWIRTDLIYPT